MLEDIGGWRCSIQISVSSLGEGNSATYLLSYADVFANSILMDLFVLLAFKGQAPRTKVENCAVRLPKEE